MTEVYSKRQFSEELDDDVYGSEAKRQEINDKKTSKPGRKPLDTEPKNKRTAQNRAAQRAFRERKERKMKELEEKIDTLESEKKSASTESEFLRLQVQMLMTELAKHRGTTDISDLNLPKVPKGGSVSSDTPSSDISSTFSPVGSDGSKSIPSNSDELNDTTAQFSFEFPWSRKNSGLTQSSITPRSNSKSSKSPEEVASNRSSSTNNIPSLQSDSSTCASNESSPFELYNNDDQNDLPLFNQVKKNVKTLSNGNRENEEIFEFNDKFDEGISEFCNELNSACGTKDCPVPKSKSQTTNFSKIDSLSNDQPLSFLNDETLDSHFTSFDPSLAFVNEDGFNDLFDENRDEVDPIASLTTEESLHDPFGIFTQAKQSPLLEKNHTSRGDQYFNLTNISEAKDTTLLKDLGIDYQDDDGNEVVPSRDNRLLKCTEIWDRITSHPKYSDIDIDGLCTELRSKAKCSDKGVVIDFADVNNVILKSLPEKE